MLLLLRVQASGEYLSQVLPGVILFALGLSATVAPLTATVLDSVQERHVGIASGINNAVSRTAGLLAIAVIGAVVAGKFTATLDHQLAGVRLSAPAQHEVNQARAAALAGTEKQHGVPASQQRKIEPAIDRASESGFHLGMGLAGALMIFGGLISALGIQDPKRRRDPGPAPRAAAAGECGRGQPAQLVDPVPGELSPVGPGSSPEPPDPPL
jgi:hypothetical protein